MLNASTAAAAVPCDCYSVVILPFNRIRVRFSENYFFFAPVWIYQITVFLSRSLCTKCCTWTIADFNRFICARQICTGCTITRDAFLAKKSRLNVLLLCVLDFERVRCNCILKINGFFPVLIRIVSVSVCILCVLAHSHF